MKNILTILLLIKAIFCFSGDLVPEVKPKHWLDLNDKFYQYRAYVYWGYNRSFFTNSDIHFHGNGYDITVYNVVAKDRPEKFSFKNYFN